MDIVPVPTKNDAICFVFFLTKSAKFKIGQ